MGTNQKGLASLAQSLPSGREEPWRGSVRGLSEARQDFVYSSNREGRTDRTPAARARRLSRVVGGGAAGRWESCGSTSRGSFPWGVARLRTDSVRSRPPQAGGLYLTRREEGWEMMAP